MKTEITKWNIDNFLKQNPKLLVVDISTTSILFAKDEKDLKYEITFKTPTKQQLLNEAILLHSKFLNKEPGGKCFNTKDYPKCFLKNAYLQNSNFSRAFFEHSDLSGADFTNSNLRNAHFYGANLEAANLSKSNIVGATFSCANLENVDFSYCFVDKNTSGISDKIIEEFNISFIRPKK